MLKLEQYGTLGKAGVALAERNEAIRRRFVRRTDLEKELKQIWDAQRKHYPQVLTEQLEKLVAKPKESVVFFQRPAQEQERYRGPLHPGEGQATRTHKRDRSRDLLHSPHPQYHQGG
jgi:hypothetical protein